jgi:hypothetical protein
LDRLQEFLTILTRHMARFELIESLFHFALKARSAMMPDMD